MKTEILALAHEYLDNAAVVVTLEAYWMLGTVEAIAYAHGIELTAEEKQEVVQTLMGEY